MNNDLVEMHSNKELLNKLKLQVNNKDQWEQFSNYLDFLIHEQHRITEQAHNMIEIHRAQGSIHTLRRLKTLRDEVNNVR